MYLIVLKLATELKARSVQAVAATNLLDTTSLAEGRIAACLGWRHRQRSADDLIRKCIAAAALAKLPRRS